MHARERLTATLTGGTPDRIAWAPLVDTYYLASLPVDYGRSRAVVDFTRVIGADVMERHSPGVTSHIDDLVSEEIVDGQRIVRRWITSVGVLTDVVYEMPESPGFPFHGAEYKLKTADDIRVYRHVWENTQCEADYQAFIDREAYIGDDGIGTVDGPQSAVQYLLGEVAGVSNFYLLLQDYPEEMEGLIETMHVKIRGAYEIIARSPAQVVNAMEDLSSTTSSPAIFERFSWRHLNEYAEILHGEDKIYLAHMCGRLKAMAQLIAESGLDGVESLTPPSIGDLTVAEAREVWGEDFILVGGLDAHVMLQADQDKVRDAVLYALKQAAPGRSFILSNADAMPYGARLDTLRTIAQVVKEHGSFPLRPN